MASRDYYLAHREEIIARSKARYDANKDAIRAYKKEWQAKNRERIKAQKAAKYQANKEELSAKAKERYRANPEPYKARAKRAREKDPDRCREMVRISGAKHRAKNWHQEKERHRAYTQANLDKARQNRARRRARERETQAEAIDYGRVLRECGGVCAICERPLDLFGHHFDHIVPLSRGGTHTEVNIQVTHAYCNLKKGAKVA